MYQVDFIKSSELEKFLNKQTYNEQWQYCKDTIVSIIYDSDQHLYCVISK